MGFVQSNTASCDAIKHLVLYFEMKINSNSEVMVPVLYFRPKNIKLVYIFHKQIVQICMYPQA